MASQKQPLLWACAHNALPHPAIKMQGKLPYNSMRRMHHITMDGSGTTGAKQGASKANSRLLYCLEFGSLGRSCDPLAHKRHGIKLSPLPQSDMEESLSELELLELLLSSAICALCSALAIFFSAFL